MRHRIRIIGTLTSGTGRGSYFTQITWVKEGIKKIASFDLYPGTLNLRVSDQDFKLFKHLAREGTVLTPPDPGFCEAKVLRLEVGGIPAVAVFPQEEVWAHKNTLELICPVHVRSIKGLEDGDPLEIQLERYFRPKAVIFDMDGTLLDSTPFFLELGGYILEQVGLNSVNEKRLLEIMNLGKDPWEELIPEMAGKESLMKKAQELDKNLFLKGYLEKVSVFEDVPKALWDLKQRGFRLAVVTTAQMLEIKKQIFQKAHIDFDSYFSLAISCQRGRPKFQAIAEAMEMTFEKLGLMPWECVYVGDASVNIEVGKALKTATIAVLTGVGTREGLEKDLPDAIATRASEILNIIETMA